MLGSWKLFLGTDATCRQISEHVLVPHGGYCLYSQVTTFGARQSGCLREVIAYGKTLQNKPNATLTDQLHKRYYLMG